MKRVITYDWNEDQSGTLPVVVDRPWWEWITLDVVDLLFRLTGEWRMRIRRRMLR